MWEVEGSVEAEGKGRWRGVARRVESHAQMTQQDSHGGQVRCCDRRLVP